MSVAPSADESFHDTIEVLENLFVLVRQLAVHGADSDSVRDGALGLGQTLLRARPPFSLQLLNGAVLRDGVPLPLSLEAFRRCQQLVGACARWGAQELVVETVPKLPELIALAEALFSATHSNRATRAPALQGLCFRARRCAGEGPSPGEAALDAFLGHELMRAFDEAERVLPASVQAWSWPDGRALAWRLERCMAASVTGTGRALELVPAPWSKGRRVVAAAFHVGAVLARLSVSPLSQRAAVHAMLAIASYGLLERDGASLDDAARAALPCMLAPNDETTTDPHRLRTCALVHAAAEPQSSAASSPLVPLLCATYELERHRCPADVGVCLSRADLQAWLAGALGREVHPGWGRALLGLLGLIPVGSHVLADGRLGVVVAPSDKGDAFRPRVLVDGKLAIPRQPVTLCSPLVTG
jgi:hypothetical protein